MLYVLFPAEANQLIFKLYILLHREVKHFEPQLELANIAFIAQPRGLWLLETKIGAALLSLFESLATYSLIKQEPGTCYGQNMGSEAL